MKRSSCINRTSNDSSRQHVTKIVSIGIVRPTIETLEPRTLLSMSASLSGGTLTFVDDASPPTGNTLSIQLDVTGQLQWSVNGGGYSNDLNTGLAGVQSALFSDLAAIVVNAGGGDDTFQLNMNSFLFRTLIAPSKTGQTMNLDVNNHDVSVALSGVEHYDLIGGEGDDTMIVYMQTGDQTVTVANSGTAGTDTITSDFLPQLQVTNLNWVHFFSAVNGASVIIFDTKQLSAVVNYRANMYDDDAVIVNGSDDVNDAFRLNMSTAGRSQIVNLVGSPVLSLLGVGQVRLNGMGGNDSFEVRGTLPRVILSGGEGSDTINFSAAHAGITIDLDNVSTYQTLSPGGVRVKLLTPIENLFGSSYEDTVYVDALSVPRYININGPGGSPGDTLCVDTLGKSSTVNRVGDSGTVTIADYQPITFAGVETLDVSDAGGGGGGGGGGGSPDLNQSSYTAEQDVVVAIKNPRKIMTANLDPNNPDPLLNENNCVDLVAIGKAGGSVSVSLNRGNGTFNQAYVVDTSLKRINDAALADVNGDGYVDIIAIGPARGGASVIALLGDGTGKFATAIPLAVSVKGKVFIDAADLTGDGLPEVIIVGPKFLMLLNNNAGSLSDGGTIVTDGKRITDIKLLKLNDDDAIDIVATGYQTGAVTCWLNNGSGAFTMAGSLGLGKAGKSGKILASGDFDGDGDMDLALSSANFTQFSMIQSNGDGTLTLQGQPDLRKQKFARWKSVAIGDVDGDGMCDLVLGSKKFDQVDVIKIAGDGAIGSPFCFKLSSAKNRKPLAMAIADFNQDGGLDIAAIMGRSNVGIVLKNLATS